MSIYARFSDEEKLRYFGPSNSRAVAMSDFIVSRRALPKPFVKAAECSSFIPDASPGVIPRSLNAILAQSDALFDVTSVTLPAGNVTKLTLKQTYCG